MTLLEDIQGPHDLTALTEAELDELAEEIRQFLIEAVARTGGHLGPNLGVVELTIALHRVFDSPADRILWDTGHQSYVHKLLTGRQDFSKLRGKGGLSGYPSREESAHDVIENSHASTVLGWADGLAKARQVRGGDDHVRAVADRYGCPVLDLWSLKSIQDRRAWDDDRLHLSAEGHTRVALRAGQVLGIDVPADPDQPWPPQPPRGTLEVRRDDINWAREYLVPWIGRRLRGESSGDHIEPKRPDLLPL